MPVEFKSAQTGKYKTVNYRSEIDGLRAIAILSVLLFHSGFKIFSGGYLGVDIFFVISGYLLTRNVSLECKIGKFSILSFYEKRVRRIIPALFFMMAITIPLAWALLTPSELVSFSRSIISVPIFVSNIFFWRDTDYFHATAELKPLLHTWSLAVEEQYYIALPIFLLLIYKFSRLSIFLIISLLSCLSLAVSYVCHQYDPMANFFLLPSRAWEFGLGALAALYKQDTPSWRKNFLGVTGFIIITLSIVLFNKDTPQPSLYTLFPTIGALLIILFATSGTLIGRILSNRFLVSIGIVSYSIYLWHQPIFAFSRNYFSNTENTLVMLTLILISMMSGYVTWYLIERPFRRATLISTRSMYIAFIVSSTLFILLGNASYEAFHSLLGTDVERRIAKTLSNSSAAYSTSMDERLFVKYRIEYEVDINTLIIGSSRVMQIGQQDHRSKLLNLGVSAASLEDVIAITYIANKKLKPASIYIGLDPWLLNSNSGLNKWRSLQETYLAAVSKIDSGIDLNTLTISSQSDPYKKSIISEIYNAINIYNFQSSAVPHAFKDKIRNDGFRIYANSYVSQSQEEIKSKFNGLLNLFMDNFKYSKKSEEVFKKFLSVYSKESEIILVLTPFHPDLYKRIKSERPIYLEIESIYRGLAKLYNIKIVGSYDPGLIGCDSTDFIDGSHPKAICMEKFLK